MPQASSGPGSPGSPQDEGGLAAREANAGKSTQKAAEPVTGKCTAGSHASICFRLKQSQTKKAGLLT